MFINTAVSKPEPTQASFVVSFDTAYSEYQASRSICSMGAVRWYAKTARAFFWQCEETHIFRAARFFTTVKLRSCVLGFSVSWAPESKHMRLSVGVKAL